MNRGSAFVEEHVLALIDASMRPRFMNRGSQAEVGDRAASSLASMRPRFMNRGSASIQSWSGETQRRFNEAPIHESGKFALHGGLTVIAESLQ